MKFKYLVLSLFILIAIVGKSQERKIGIVPFNSIWILPGSFRPSLQIKTTQSSDWLVVTYIKGVSRINSWTGGEDGFGLEYRVNLNRDPNLIFKTHSYIGIYYTQTSNKRTEPFFNDYKRSSGGALIGTNIELNENLFIEIFLGLGLGTEKDLEIEDTWNYIDITGGLNIGFRL